MVIHPIPSRTGQSRGCGKVEYASIEQAEEAVHKLNGKATREGEENLIYCNLTVPGICSTDLPVLMS